MRHKEKGIHVVRLTFKRFCTLTNFFQPGQLPAIANIERLLKRL
jgi:hypothetical protein